MYNCDLVKVVRLYKLFFMFVFLDCLFIFYFICVYVFFEFDWFFFLGFERINLII